MNELQNIQLPGFLITDWYKSHLILSEEKTEQVNVPATEPKKIIEEVLKEPVWFLGENKKNITIVINQSSQNVIEESWKIFLTNVLKACNFSLDDTVIVNLNVKAITYNELKTQFKSKYLLVFDTEPSLLGIPAAIPDYEIRVDDNCAIVFSESIHKMLPDTAEAKQIKMKLWTSLKKIFNV